MHKAKMDFMKVQIPISGDMWKGAIGSFEDSEDPDETARMRSLIWASAVCLQNHCTYNYENTPIQIYWKFYNQKR